LYLATFAPRWLSAARDLAERMRELFSDREGGGFFYAARDAEPLVARTRDLEDHPTPAGSSQAAWVLLRLAALTGDPAPEAEALGALRLVRDEIGRWPPAFRTALVALGFPVSDPRDGAIA